jgi:hypothetical protein
VYTIHQVRRSGLRRVLKIELFSIGATETTPDDMTTAFRSLYIWTIVIIQVFSRLAIHFDCDLANLHRVILLLRSGFGCFFGDDQALGGFGECAGRRRRVCKGGGGGVCRSDDESAIVSMNMMKCI